jgi:prepilin-type processing-associated H-X9-DG protein
MLFPALSKARETGKKILCAGNMKNVGLGISMYGSDWDAYMPAGWNGESTWTKIIHNDYVKGKSIVFQCPACKYKAEIPDDFSSNSNKTYGLFCANANAPYYGMGTWKSHTKMTTFLPPSKFVVLTDTVETSSANEPECYLVGCNQPYAGAKIQLRHIKTSNVFFIDGHIDSEKMQSWAEHISNSYVTY